MKKILLTLICAICFLISKGQCPTNGNLELNNLSNWQGYTGMNTNPINISSFTPGFHGTKHMIQSSGPDPLIPALNKVSQGLHSVRLGDNSFGNATAEAAILSYTFTVTNINFSFRYALVMMEAGHPRPEPVFSYWLSTNNNLALSTLASNLITVPPFEIYQDRNDDRFEIPEEQPIHNQFLMYKPWERVCIDMSMYMGQQVTIYFLVGNCSHLSYAYIDDICSAVDMSPVVNLQCAPHRFCSTDNVFLNGAGSLNYEGYDWIITNLSTGDVATYSRNKPMIGNSNIGKMYKDIYGTMPNGQYEITLRLRTCENYVEDKCIIDIWVPEIEAENVFICCNSGQTTVDLTASTIIQSGSSGQLEWFDAEGNPLGSGTTTITGNVMTSVITVNAPQLMAKFKVMYDGCNTKKWVTALMMPANAAVKIHDENTYCDCQSPVKLKGYLAPTPCNNVQASSLEWELWKSALEEEYVQWQWNNTATTQDILIDPYNPHLSTYNLTATWPCGASATSMNEIVPYQPFHNAFDNLTYTTAVNLPSNIFVILASPPSLLTYNAFQYKLEIFDRWGNLVYSKTATADCSDDFYNGEISWDGVGNQGTYNGFSNWNLQRLDFYLQLKNCTINDVNSNGTTIQGNFIIQG